MTTKFHWPEKWSLHTQGKGKLKKNGWCCVACVCAQSCLVLCNPMDCSPSSSSVYGILQARILERVAIPFSRGSFQTRDQTCVSYVSCIGRWILYHCTTSTAFCGPLCQDYSSPSSLCSISNIVLLYLHH